MLFCGPLKTEVVAIWIVEIQLLHSIMRDLRIFQVGDSWTKVFVGRVHIGTPEVDRRIVVSGDSNWIGFGGT